MTSQQLSLGEYIRRLRRDKKWNLQAVAERSGLAYTHLSRIENDSTVPGPDTVAKLAEALGGDLKLMLEMADCLPRQILDRISSRPSTPSPALKRAAGGPARPSATRTETQALALVRAARIPAAEEAQVAEAIVRLVGLDRSRRNAIVQLLQGYLREERSGKG